MKFLIDLIFFLTSLYNFLGDTERPVSLTVTFHTQLTVQFRVQLNNITSYTGLYNQQILYPTDIQH